MIPDRLPETIKRTKVLLVVLLVAAALITGGTYSYLADTDAATPNTVKAGTLNIQLDGVDDGATGSFTIGGGSTIDGKPGDAASHNYSIENTGTISADHVEIAFSVKEPGNELTEPTDSDLDAELTATETASLLNVTTLEYQNESGATLVDFLGSGVISDSNGNGITDLADVLAAGTQDDLVPPQSNSGNNTYFVITLEIANDDSSKFIKGGNTAGNLTGYDEDIMADNVEVTIEFTLNQDATQ